jgi:UDP-N-acetylenolpyruvoylglucosamine reductase
MINPGEAHTNDIMTLINDVDMSVLTEDVVATGHYEFIWK